MNVLIIYKSYHRMNTEKVAKAMAETMNATLQKVEEAKPEDLSKYDLIGFGSGIYGGKYHKDMVSLVEKMPRLEKNVFLFSTAGKPQEKYEHGHQGAAYRKRVPDCRRVPVPWCRRRSIGDQPVKQGAS